MAWRGVAWRACVARRCADRCIPPAPRLRPRCRLRAAAAGLVKENRRSNTVRIKAAGTGDEPGGGFGAAAAPTGATILACRVGGQRREGELPGGAGSGVDADGGGSGEDGEEPLEGGLRWAIGAAALA